MDTREDVFLYHHLNACAFLSAEGIPEEVLQQVLTEEYLHYIQSRRNLFTRLLFRVKWFFKVRKQHYQFARKVAEEAESKQIEGFKAQWAFMQNEMRKFRYVVSPLDSFQLKQLMEPALAYSMLKRDAATKHLFIHRLVQTVLKFELASDTQRQWAERIIATVNQLFPSPSDVKQWGTCDRLLPSALTCAELIETYSIETEVAAQLLNWTAYYLHNRKGEYDQALPLSERASAIWEQVLGPAHPDYATSLNNLALLYYDKGEHDQALPLSERALAIREQVLGPAHPDYAQSLNNLAELYRAKGKYDQALSLSERVLAIREQVLGSAHPDFATSLNNLAGLYRDKGEYDQALPLYERALAITEQVLGPAHPNYATSLNNLATLYQAKGEYDQALPLFERALAIREQVLGPAHPDYAAGLNNLAGLYDSKGEYDQALPLFERALAILKKVLGEKHPTTKKVEGNYQGCLAKITD